MAALFIVAGIVWQVGGWFDLHEWLHDTIGKFEWFNLDELLMGIMFFGFAGFVYSNRRIRDLTREAARRRKAEHETRWIARHDVLTQLPNRQFIEDYVADHRASSPDESLCPPLTAFKIDIHGLKKVNDLAGRSAGDAFLVEMAARLTRAYPGALTARFGGDEFLLLFSGTLARPADIIARALIDAVSAPFPVGQTGVEPGASIGHACWPSEVDDIGMLLHAADIAMHAAADTGPGAIRAFDAVLGAEASRRVKAEQELRAAIRTGEVQPWFQPLVDLESGQVIGFEALARWVKPDGGIISPAQFIPLAEETGMIVEMSEHLLRAACREAAGWPAGVSLSFNISPLQLGDQLLGLRIIQVLAETGLTPNRLEIEITESAFIGDTATAIGVIADLHRAGVRIALDDFGTGYSSMSQLANLTVHKIKIDRSFIADCMSDGRQMSIVKAILSLSQSLGLRTTAEGLEKDAQVAGLRALGCDIGQGYVFGKAMPAAEARALVCQPQEKRLRA